MASESVFPMANTMTPSAIDTPSSNSHSPSTGSPPLPAYLLGTPAYDTTTLAAHDFDVDNRSGFMPPHAPLRRLPGIYGETWEHLLDDAQGKLVLGTRQNDVEKDEAESWRDRVRGMGVLGVDGMGTGEETMRRAHLVLTWLMHFYIRSCPAAESFLIPASIGIPLVRVSSYLDLPPVITYSDDVLYNWRHSSESSLEINTSFTNTPDEAHFYLTSARIELRGVEALALMRSTMDELFVSDTIASTRITSYLTRMASVIRDMTHLLTDVRDGCDPRVFYEDIRPWFRGMDPSMEEWIFEGVEEEKTRELSGPSAGQSSLIHAIDIFLGVEASSSSSEFLSRMRIYMPRHHRNFLSHLRSAPRPLRSFVLDRDDTKLTDAYNGAITALKEFRDKHIVVVTTYIIQPAAREKKEKEEKASLLLQENLKGTGGTNLVRFLKDVRDGTKGARVELQSTTVDE